PVEEPRLSGERELPGPGIVVGLLRHRAAVALFHLDAAREEQAGHFTGLVVARVHARSEEHTSEPQSLAYLVCRLLLEKKKTPQPGRRGALALPSPGLAVVSARVGLRAARV